MRVVFTVLDALPARHVSADHTPVLHDLARNGAWSVDGARAVMTSATYPNHATFITGAAPSDHGVVTNWIPQVGRVVPAWKRGPSVATLFDVVRASGRGSAAVVGDQHLVGVMGAHAADEHWPPNGNLPDGTELDAMGYADDRETIVEIVGALESGADFVVAHLNGPDTYAHLFGPDSDDALAGYRETDSFLGVMREHLRWDDTVWIIVSDHDQETVDDREPVDLQAEIERRGLPLFALPEGNASLLCGEGAQRASAWLGDVEGIEGAAPFPLADGELECMLVWSAPGRAFGFGGTPTRLGTHGGPRTRAQVAVVAGGHDAVSAMSRALDHRVVDAADWAPTIASLLDVQLATATGRALFD
jgi:arylsulfatase A-like enzyme